VPQRQRLAGSAVCIVIDRRAADQVLSEREVVP
jgi:hypothetical protein